MRGWFLWVCGNSCFYEINHEKLLDLNAFRLLRVVWMSLSCHWCSSKMLSFIVFGNHKCGISQEQRTFTTMISWNATFGSISSHWDKESKLPHYTWRTHMYVYICIYMYIHMCCWDKCWPSLGHVFFSGNPLLPAEPSKSRFKMLAM